MSSSKKGFDPLASLFDLPESNQPPPTTPTAPPAKGDALPEPPHVRPAPPIVPPSADVAPAAPPPPKLAGPDPAQLAKILARAAAAKAGPPKPAAGGATIVPDTKPAKAAAKPAAPPAPVSRLMGAPPPKKTLSLEDAMKAAAEGEEKRKVAAAAPTPPPPAPTPAASPRPAAAPAATSAAPVPATAPSPAETIPGIAQGDLADVVSGVVSDALPGIGALYVPKALIMDDRGVLTALWRGHRARFASTGDVSGAVAVSAVLRALARVQPGQLAVAHAVTDKTDWLIWVDLSTGTLIAAFKDARAWFGGA